MHEIASKHLPDLAIKDVTRMLYWQLASALKEVQVWWHFSTLGRKSAPQYKYHVLLDWLGFTLRGDSMLLLLQGRIFSTHQSCHFDIGLPALIYFTNFHSRENSDDGDR